MVQNICSSACSVLRTSHRTGMPRAGDSTHMGIQAEELLPSPLSRRDMEFFYIEHNWALHLFFLSSCALEQGLPSSWYYCVMMPLLHWRKLSLKALFLKIFSGQAWHWCHLARLSPGVKSVQQAKKKKKIRVFLNYKCNQQIDKSSVSFNRMSFRWLAEREWLSLTVYTHWNRLFQVWRQRPLHAFIKLPLKCLWMS